MTREELLQEWIAVKTKMASMDPRSHIYEMSEIVAESLLIAMREAKRDNQDSPVPGSDKAD